MSDKPKFQVVQGGKGATREQIRLLELVWKAKTSGLSPHERSELNRLTMAEVPKPQDPGPDDVA